MHAYSFLIYRPWESLDDHPSSLSATATRSPRALATWKGPTVGDRRWPSRNDGTASTEIDQVGRSRVQIPAPTRGFFSANFPLNMSIFSISVVCETICTCVRCNLCTINKRSTRVVANFFFKRGSLTSSDNGMILSWKKPKSVPCFKPGLPWQNADALPLVPLWQPSGNFL